MIAAHPNDYLPTDGWQEKASGVLKGMLPKALSKLLDEMLAVRLEEQQNAKVSQPEPSEDDDRRLGFG